MNRESLTRLRGGRVRRSGSTPPDPRIKSWTEFETPHGTARVGAQRGLFSSSRVRAVWGEQIPTACYVATWLGGPRAPLRFQGSLSIGEHEFQVSRPEWHLGRERRRIFVDGPDGSWYATASGLASTELRRRGDDSVVAAAITYPLQRWIAPDVTAEETTLVFVAIKTVMPFVTIGLGW